MAAPDNPLIRWHAMDALRASMMLFGILLHGSLAYTANFPTPWPIANPLNHPFFASLALILHLFRMEVFFCISGFFGYQLLQKIGVSSFIKNRTRKIFIPFLISWPLIIIALSLIPMQTAPTFQLTGIPIYHLWFLYYLLFFYIFTIMLLGLNKTFMVFKKNLIQPLDKYFLKILSHRYHVFFLSGTTFFCLVGIKTVMVETPLYFSLKPQLLMYYGVFFIFGWMISRQPALLQIIADKTKRYAVLALLYCLSLMIVPNNYASAIATWSCVLFCIGFCHRYATTKFSFIRYLSKASYWIYLAHVPLIIALQNHLYTSTLPVFIKFLSVVLLSIVILLLSYQSMIWFLQGMQFIRTKIKPEPLNTPNLKLGKLLRDETIKFNLLV
jgi:glucan biosynthesis protein C